MGAQSSIPQERMAYFYFDKQRLDSTQVTHALRAILAQLIQTLRNDKDAIDILTILWDQNQTGQLTAGNSEISSALSLIMRRGWRLSLLVDGVDECTDQASLFDFLTQISEGSNVISIALFSRPTVQIPSSLQNYCLQLNLGSILNFPDIRSFLHLKIESLSRDATLCFPADVENIVQQICERANGMFLWARLFISYLESPMLSKRQRSEAIEHMSRLEGLDSLYATILESLERQYPHQARENISQAFQLVAFAYQPLTVDELHYALAIPPDRKFQPEDLIPQFEENLSRMSGALMETVSDNTVRFIHLSVLEYLLDRSSTHGGLKPLNGRYSMNPASGYGLHARSCLSYLYYSVEHERLGDSIGTIPDRHIQKNRYPFLEYAARYWSSYLLDFVQMQFQSPGEKKEFSESIVRLATNLISSQKAIMVWIEASYMFEFLPEIGNRPDQQQWLRETAVIVSKGAPQKNAIRYLQRLSEDLQNLNSSWAAVLFSSPNEIWEPSVSAFTKSPFWVSIHGSKISRFQSKDSMKGSSISLKSQVSGNGRLLGVVRLLHRPDSFAGYSITYEIWGIEKRKLLYQGEIDIPEEIISMNSTENVRQSSANSLLSFQCPVAMSADLSRIAVPGTIAKIDGECLSSLEDLEDLEQRSIHIQHLPFSLPGPATDDLLLRSIPNGAFSQSYAIQISQSGEFVFVLHRSSRLIDISPTTAVTLCLIAVYQDNSSKLNEKPSYRYITSIAFKPLQLRIAIHPFLPIVAFKHNGTIVVPRSKGKHRILEERDKDTALWDFANRGNPLLIAANT